MTSLTVEHRPSEAVKAPTVWHRFTSGDDGDSECSACGVIVSDTAFYAYLNPCPEPPCTAGTGDGVCVFARGPGGPACTDCGRPGNRTAGVTPGGRRRL